MTFAPKCEKLDEKARMSLVSTISSLEESKLQTLCIKMGKQHKARTRIQNSRVMKEKWIIRVLGETEIDVLYESSIVTSLPILFPRNAGPYDRMSSLQELKTIVGPNVLPNDLFHSGLFFDRKRSLECHKCGVSYKLGRNIIEIKFNHDSTCDFWKASESQVSAEDVDRLGSTHILKESNGTPNTTATAENIQELHWKTSESQVSAEDVDRLGSTKILQETNGIPNTTEIAENIQELHERNIGVDYILSHQLQLHKALSRHDCPKQPRKQSSKQKIVFPTGETGQSFKRHILRKSDAQLEQSPEGFYYDDNTSSIRCVFCSWALTDIKCSSAKKLLSKWRKKILQDRKTLNLQIDDVVSLDNVVTNDEKENRLGTGETRLHMIVENLIETEKGRLDTGQNQSKVREQSEKEVISEDTYKDDDRNTCSRCSSLKTCMCMMCNHCICEACLNCVDYCPNCNKMIQCYRCKLTRPDTVLKNCCHLTCHKCSECVDFCPQCNNKVSGRQPIDLGNYDSTEAKQFTRGIIM